MASRDPRLLDSNLMLAWQKFYDFARNEGIDLILTCTHRSLEEQGILYAQGRTSLGRIVTWAKPGQSKHNLNPSKAFDVAIVKDGKCVWDTEDKAWGIVGKIGLTVGLVWGGTWPKRKREFPHFEVG